MERYRILYRIRVKHGYFDNGPCPALQCRLTPQGGTLARRRGLLFRQTAPGEWTLLFRDRPAEDDLLTLDLSVADPAFTLYTAWDGFRPQAAYELELPAEEEAVEATAAIRPSDRKRAIGSGFCTLGVRLTAEMAEAAESGQPMQAELYFKEAAAQWEYLFIPTGGNAVPPGQLQLEDTAGKVQFAAFRQCEAYGRQAVCTTSRSRVPMRMTYGCRLRLTVQEEGRQKRILLPQVAPPEPGRYMDAPQGILRQICYY